MAYRALEEGTTGLENKKIRADDRKYASCRYCVSIPPKSGDDRHGAWGGRHGRQWTERPVTGKNMERIVSHDGGRKRQQSKKCHVSTCCAV